MIAFALWAAVASAVTPAEIVDETLQLALVDLAVCPGPPEASRWRATWTFDGRGRASLTELVGVDGAAPPERFAACAAARFAELRIPEAANWTWIRTLTMGDDRLALGPMTVRNVAADPAGACARAAAARRPSVGGLLAIGVPADTSPADAIVLREELGDAQLAACLDDAHVSALAPAPHDRMVAVTLAVPVEVPDDPLAHAPLDAEQAPADAWWSSLDRAFDRLGAVAPPELRAARDREACDAGVAAACGSHAWHRVGEPPPIDVLAALGPACEAGDPIACVPFAWTLHDAAAAEALAPACEAGLLRACTERARVGPDEARQDALQALCDRGEPVACLLLGRDLLDGAPHRGRALLRRSVGLGEAAGWYDLGRWWTEGLGGVRDRAAAEVAWQRGCASGVPRACDALRRWYGEGGWSGRTALDAVPWNRAGCEAGDAASCSWSAADRIGEIGQLDEAIAAFERACALGDEDACVERAALAILGPRPAPDGVDPLATFEAACDPDDLDDWAICKAAEHLRRGDLLGTVGPRAVELLTKRMMPAHEDDIADGALACTPYGEMSVGLTLDEHGEILALEVLATVGENEDAVPCVDDALRALELPRLREGEVGFLRLDLSFRDQVVVGRTEPTPWIWASGRVDLTSKLDGERIVALPELRGAAREDLALGTCFDGSELYPAIFDVRVTRSGRTRKVTSIVSTGSEEVDACMADRLRALRLPWHIDAGSRIILGVRRE